MTEKNLEQERQLKEQDGARKKIKIFATIKDTISFLMLIVFSFFPLGKILDISVGNSWEWAFRIFKTKNMIQQPLIFPGIVIVLLVIVSGIQCIPDGKVVDLRFDYSKWKGFWIYMGLNVVLLVLSAICLGKCFELSYISGAWFFVVCSVYFVLDIGFKIFEQYIIHKEVPHLDGFKQTKTFFGKYRSEIIDLGIELVLVIVLVILYF